MDKIKRVAERLGIGEDRLMEQLRERGVKDLEALGEEEIERIAKEGKALEDKVIEKRVKPTVIRRRRRDLKPKKEEKRLEVKAEVQEKVEQKEERERQEELKRETRPSKRVVEFKPEEAGPRVVREVSPPERGKKRFADRRREEEIIKRKDILEEKEQLHKIQPKKKKKQEVAPSPAKKVVKMAEVISVGELAKRMGIKASEVIKKLMDLGVVATINQYIDVDTAILVASEFGYEVESTGLQVADLIEEVEDRPEDLKPRPPVVTVMGHVDHGKTSLLDAIRKTNVTGGEAGGITQHIGAYHVHLDKGDITFLDTPGHEAFTAMRARGAKVTDIVILVVAADDGVMPQTVEAINHAKAAGVPIVVAINKIDLPDANPERVKQALTEYGLVPEEWGGDTIFVEVSAKKGIGIKDLLEYILLQAEMLELKANPNKPAKGTIIESKLERGRGPVATVLVQEGTLRVGDVCVAGVHAGRVRALINERGERIKEAGPSMPVEVLGLSGVPEAGDSFNVVKDEVVARKIVEIRMAKQKEKELAKTSKVSLQDLYDRIEKGDIKELNVVVKGDVQGSVEAVTEALKKLGTDKVKVQVIHSGVGGVSENDVMLASASNAIIIGFNVRAEAKARELAEREGVDIRFYSVIYDLVEDVKKAMEGLLEPTYREEFLGMAEVRQIFNVPKVGVVAGCYVTKGKITRGSNIRLIRDNIVVYEGKLASLKRFKEDVKEVAAGYECGLAIENYKDIKVGDVIEAYTLEKVASTL